MECAAVVVVVAVSHVGAGSCDAPLLDFVEDGTVEKKDRAEVFDLSIGVVVLSCSVAERERPRGGETFVDAVFDAK